MRGGEDGHEGPEQDPVAYCNYCTIQYDQAKGSFKVSVCVVGMCHSAPGRYASRACESKMAGPDILEVRVKVIPDDDIAPVIDV